MGRSVFILSVFSVFLLCKVNGYSKRWIWSTSWDDPKNWDKQRVPCSQDTIELSEGVIIAGNKTEFGKSVVLPANGELVFDENIELSVGGAKSVNQDCPKGEPMTFIGNTAKDWFNPLNWNFMENNAIAPWNNGTLFMDRIPCINDQIYFPEGDAFKVSVSGKAEVAEIFLSKKSVADMSSYLSSNEGQLRFKISSGSSLTLNKNPCTQQFGCPCGYSKMKNTICKLFECPPSCENKVKPEGDCCERCGVLLKTKLNRNFNLATCQRNLQNNLAKSSDNNGVTLVVSPIVDNNAIERAQILLTDNSNGNLANEAADSTLSYLQSGKDNACSVFDTMKETSSGNKGTSGKSTGTSGSSSSTVALAVTLTLVLLMVLLASMYLLYRRKKGLVIFRKQVLHNEMDITGSHSVEMIDTDFSGNVMDYGFDTMTAPGKDAASFANPMYDEAVPSGPAVIEAKGESPRLEPIKAKPLKKQKKETKSRLLSKGKSKSANDNGNDAFENPVYADFSQDIGDSFDKAYNVPVPGDTGFSNPMYGDLYSQGEADDVTEVKGNLPPSFLDEIGFSPGDVDDAINAVNRISNDSANIQAVTIGFEDEFDVGAGNKGESEA